MSPAPIVRGNRLVPREEGGNLTQQLQPPAPDARGSRPAPRRTPSGNTLVWDGVEFVKLPGGDIHGRSSDEDWEWGVEMEDDDDII
jgi:hypothetical protein